MSLNFPDSPSLNQIYQQDGMSYEWTGSKWRRIDTSENSIVVEYSDIVEQTASTVSIEPDKYSYFKIDVDDNTTITIPSASPYSNFVVELALGTTAYTVSWSNNVEWAGGSAPSYNYGYAAKVLLDFTTYDGTNWIGSELLDYEVFVYSFQGSVSGYTSGTGPEAARIGIDKFSFASDGNATTVGDLTYSSRQSAGQSSAENGYTTGGIVYNTIHKFSFTSDGNASDIADLTQARYGGAGQSSVASGYTSGGATPSNSNVIDKFPFASDGNATDVGDLTIARARVGGQSSDVSGYTSGGQSPAKSDVIDKFPFATDANATDVGDLIIEITNQGTGQSSSENGYMSGGEGPPAVGGVTNIIQKFSFASDANATDVGDLTLSNQNASGQSSTVSGYTSGGRDGSEVQNNIIQKFPFASDANATDVGDLTETAAEVSGNQV